MSEKMIGLIVAFAIVALLIRTVNQATRRKQWQAAAARLGLEHQPRDWLIWGTIDGVDVRVQTYFERAGRRSPKNFTAFELRPAQPAKLTLGRPGTWDKLVAARDLAVGDEAFDRCVCLQGSLEDALAVLSPTSRAKVCGAVQAAWTFEVGAWRWHTDKQRDVPIEDRVHQGVALAKLLELPHDSRPRDGSASDA